MASQKSTVRILRTQSPLTKLAILFALLFLLSVMTGPQSAIASDPLDGQRQCQQCLDQAYADFQACIAVTDDEGEDVCHIEYDGNVMNCQRTACIY